jgi:hypothetical protein
MTAIFTVAQSGKVYQVVMTIVANQYVVDTANTAEEAAEKAARLNKAFAAGKEVADKEADEVDEVND